MGIDASDLGHVHDGDGSGTSSYLNRIRRHRAVACAVIETLSNLTSASLSLWLHRDPADVFTAVTLNSPSVPADFPDMAAFHAFLALADECPPEFVARVTTQPKAWRPLFQELERNILLSRGRRTEPLVRLLRDHWAWRWLELASLYSAQVSGGSDPLAWQKCFSEGLLTSQFVPIDGTDLKVLVGPVRDERRGGLDQHARLSAMVERFYETLSGRIKPHYSLDRLGQFFFSRPPLSKDDLGRAIAAIRYVFAYLGTWPDRDLDLADLQGAVIFGHALGETQVDYQSHFASDPPLTFHVPYRLLRPGEGPPDRALLFRGRNLQPPEGVSSPYSTPQGEGAPPALRLEGEADASNRFDSFGLALSRRLSKATLAIHSAGVQRGLEELLLLRYKLSDNFGVLTAHGAAAPQSPLQGTGDSAADRTADKELGRRIAREVAEVTGADIGLIYRYDYLHDHLDVVGLHSDPGLNPPIQLGDYGWMREAGHVKASRDDAVAYNAADRARPAAYNCMVPTGAMVHEMATQAKPAADSPVPHAGSILAVPIRVFGRVWGVVQVVSVHRGWFDTRDLEILQRVADLIGPYYHEHLLMKMLYNIANGPAESAADHAFVALAEELREMTLSDGACVWRADSINSDEFSLSGCSGRDDLAGPAGTGRPKIIKGATNSIAVGVMAEHEAWFAGTIGEPPLDGEWLCKPHTRTLQAAGFRFLALLPVYGESRRAVISLYSKKSPFSESWQSWGAFIAKYIGVVLSRVYGVEEKERSGRRLIAHEIVNSVRIARGSSNKVFDWSKTLPKQEIAPELHNWKSDISTYLDLIENLISGWSDAEAENVPAGVVLVTALRNTVANRPEVAVSLRDEFNSSLQPLSADMRLKKLSVNIIIDDRDVSVRIHREAMKMILSNLSSNAVKYSNLGAPIQLRVVRLKFGMRVTLRNLGTELATGEEDRIFDMEFRGSRTQEGIPGKGLGLYITKQVCDAYGITLSYDVQPAPQAGEVWHQFSLEFPKSRIEFWGTA